MHTISQYRDLNYKDGFKLSGDEIGNLLLHYGIIPNYYKWEETKFQLKFPKSVVFRKDFSFFYKLKIPTYQNNRVIKWKELDDELNELNVIAVINKHYYYDLILIHVNRKYPMFGDLEDK